VRDSDIPDSLVRTVTLSAYSIAINDTSKAQWDSVRTWALTHGYTDLAVGAGKSANHPVQTVSWFNAVKWANAASEKAGLTPCYRVNGGTYRTGTSGGVTCDWKASTKSGYRLPTEAEWEVAARGGLIGKRFPLGDTIDQSQSNYYASSGYSYDLSAYVNNYHPDYANGEYPYTSPLGSSDGNFAANGYGLYDMAGNVNQWCWDWYGTIGSVRVDPKGASNGSQRVMRGGYWRGSVDVARCARRQGGIATNANNFTGFRLVRSVVLP